MWSNWHYYGIMILMAEFMKPEIMDEKISQQVAETLKAIAHPVRLQIVALLEKRELCVGRIVELLGARHSITSQQLNMMKDKGVLACRRDGANVYYRLENPNVSNLLHCIYHNCQLDEKVNEPNTISESDEVSEINEANNTNE